MKTTRSFLIGLLGLALTASFFIQQTSSTNQMNQASLISFAGTTIDSPDPETSVLTTNNDESLVLPGILIDNEYMPLINLPEVKIEDEINRDQMYPAVKVDGKYIPHIQLKEVKIKAN